MIQMYKYIADIPHHSVLLHSGCGLPCSKRPERTCLGGMLVDVIEFRTLAIPFGIPAGQVRAGSTTPCWLPFITLVT